MELITKLTSRIRQIYQSFLNKILSNLFQKNVKILFLGVDNAGKTTLLYKLKDETVKKSLPTFHANKAEVDIGKMKVSIVDLGGHKAARLAWDDFFFSCDGVLFLVDVKDELKFNDVKQAYQSVRNNLSSGNIPMAVLFNKIDLFNHNPISAENDFEFTQSLKNKCGIEEDEKTRCFYLSVAEEDPQNENGELIRIFSWMQKMIVE